MSHIILVLVMLVVTFMLAGYGVYANVEAERRTQLAYVVGSTLERDAVYVQDVAADLGRVPTADDVDGGRFTRESSATTVHSFLVKGGAAYVCAKVNRADDFTRGAMTKVANDHPGAFVSGDCGDNSAALDGAIAVSMQVG